MSYVEHRIIKGKPVYIAEKHHHILEAWADYRNTVDEAPLLLSLDHHTDTREPFITYVCREYKHEDYWEPLC
jgi:hypothetical protein